MAITAFLEKLPLGRDRPALGYGVALVLCGLGFLVRVLVDGWMPPGFPYVTFFPAVILTAFFFGLGPAILSAVLCGLIAWYYFIPPFNSFALTPSTSVALGFFACVAGVDIAVTHFMQVAGRRAAHARLRAARAAETRELLFRELQHRVSNNIQMVAAVLTLQKRTVADPHAREALDEAARRLALVGKISRQLHDPNGTRLGMKAFLERLAEDLIDATGKPEIAVSVTADEGITLPSEAGVPVALIVAEAVSNALEHGFQGREGGTIHIDLARRDDRIVLSVADNGRGLPDGFSARPITSLGLTIATTLARQLGGTFEMVSDGGVTARLLIPAAPAKRERRAD